MKFLRIYEDFDFDEEDFDFEEFDEDKKSDGKKIKFGDSVELISTKILLY